MVANNVMEQPKADKVGLAPNQQISHRLRAQVRTLYLVEGHNPKTIEALGVGLTAMQISNLANREGWSRQRSNAAAKIKQTAIARTEAAVAQVAEAISVESEELCFKALEVTRAGLTEGGLNGAKQAQAASSTLKNLATTARMLREPAGSPTGEATVTNFNLFFAPAATKAEQQVTEVEAKQVT